MQSREITILLADDDAEDLDMLKQALLDEDPALKIECVFNGQEVLTKLKASTKEELPSLIILDYKMPVFGAVETLESLRNNIRYATIPKVVWSTSDRHEHRKRCIEIGAVSYFAKPIGYDALVKAAREMLKIALSGHLPG
jgi:CheY-like chemotaxis protein